MDCALERCGEVENYLKEIVNEPSGTLPLEIIGYVEKLDSNGRIPDRFDAYLSPAVIAVDRSDESVHRFE